MSTTTTQLVSAGLVSVAILSGLVGHAHASATRPLLPRPPVQFGPPRTPPLERSETRPLDGEQRPADAESDWLRSVLLTPGADLPTRRGAATRLLTLRDDQGRPRPAAVAVLEEVLRGTDESAIEAALTAMEATDPLRAELAPAILGLVRIAPTERRGRVSGVVGRLSAAAVPYFAAQISDAELDLSQRLAAVWTLAAMRGPERIAALVEFLEPDGATEAEIVDSICAALERLFANEFDCDRDRWVRWWRDLSAQSSDEDSATLRRRIDVLVRENEVRLAALDGYAKRLVETYAELFLTLNAENRQVRTLRLLTDELPVVRAFALTQVDRMVRNGESPSEDLQQGLLARLDDEVGSVRRDALVLLDRIGRPNLAAEVAPAFIREREPQTIQTYLDIYQKRAAPSTFERMLELLDSPQFAEDAARAIVELAEETLLDGPRTAQVVPVARRLLDGRESPAFVRLLGAAGEEADLARVAALLDSPDRAVRRAAAESMRLRGRADSLRARAGDEAIYPILVRALAESATTIDRFRELVDLEPPTPELAADRISAVRRALAKLVPTDLAAADELLRLRPWCDDRLRLEGLARVPELPPSALPPAIRRDLLLRLATTQIRIGDARTALATLDRLAGTQAAQPTSDASAAAVSEDIELRNLRFQAAALSGQFEIAAALDTNAESWVTLLTEAWKRKSVAAGPLADEISRRFRGQFSDGAREQFDAMATDIRETLRNASERNEIDTSARSG